MQALLEHFITQSVIYSLIAVALVAFLAEALLSERFRIKRDI